MKISWNGNGRKTYDNYMKTVYMTWQRIASNATLYRIISAPRRHPGVNDVRVERCISAFLIFDNGAKVILVP